MNKKNLLLISIAGLAGFAHAEQVSDPFPEKIVAASHTVSLEPVVTFKSGDSPLWSPVDLLPAGDGSDRLFIVDQAGIVHLLKGGKLQPTPFLDVRKRLVKIYPGFDERGLLGIAFHPKFKDNGLCYTYTSEPIPDGVKPDFDREMDQDKRAGSTHHSVLAEWRAKGDQVDASSFREVLRFTQPQWNHNSGCMAFGSDGMLYLSTGDGGKGNDLAPGHAEGGNGQNLQTVLGKVLRIDVNTKSEGKRYGIPADNPFVGKDGLDEIWAYGLRNPWRISFDPPTGRLVLADVGQNLIEEVNIITKGGNFGWRVMEGSFGFDPKVPKSVTRLSKGANPKLIRPVVEYDHDEGVSISGGHVYRGAAIPALAGKYVFADWKWKGIKPKALKEGTVDGLLVADLESGRVDKLELSEPGKHPGRFVTALGRDAAGELYVLTHDKPSPFFKSGRVYKLVAGR